MSAYDLYRADGRRLSLGRDDWHRALKTAKGNNWLPVGTMIPNDPAWCGSYKGSSGQIITPPDSTAMAAALEGTAYEVVGEFIRGQKIYIF